MTIGSLFAGIGGFDIAARWLGWQTKWYSEIDPYACAVMRKHFPKAINHGDIRNIDGRAVEQVDILCGGFPCQDISTAGRGAGIGGSRSGLWKEYARLIEEIEPRYVVAENVSALRSRGLDVVLQDLNAFGYDAEWNCIPASYVGALHRRDRIWIVAYHSTQRLQDGGRTPLVQSSALEKSERRSCSNSILQTLADTDSQRLQGSDISRSREVLGVERNESPRSGSEVGKYWEVEPNLGRVADGVPSRVDRVKCIGNAIVPQVAHFVFQAIARREERLAA